MVGFGLTRFANASLLCKYGVLPDSIEDTMDQRTRLDKMLVFLFFDFMIQFRLSQTKSACDQILDLFFILQ